MKRTFLSIGLAAGLLAAPLLEAAEQFYCEVLSVAGDVTATDGAGSKRLLAEGDLLSAGETVQAGKDSTVYLAFDKDWKNVTQIEADSKMKLASVLPAKLTLESGGLFSKLKQLPKDSSFEVKTPTAVATVRGSEYRTTFIGGETQVYNASSSKVYVYGVNSDGSTNRSQEVVLDKATKTGVGKAGDVPAPPVPFLPEEQEAVETLTRTIETRIEEVQSTGRVSKIQSVQDMETYIAANRLEANPTEESRVTDLRRRPFKKSE